VKILITLLLVLFSGVGIAFADPVTKTYSENKIHFVDEQIMVVADISNNQDTPQNFAYLTQVKTMKMWSFLYLG